jgi:two-component system nitrogen regulation sensor histidine kinase NtrY
MRAAVTLAIDRKKGVFGSSLRTKLVSAFIAFAVLPTVVLLYTTGKFVDTNFEKWLPSGLADLVLRSAASEKGYQGIGLRALQSLDLSDLGKQQKIEFVDFVYDAEEGVFWEHAFSSVAAFDQSPFLGPRVEAVFSTLDEGGAGRWIVSTRQGEPPLALRRLGPSTVAGIIGPEPIHPAWQVAEQQFAGVGSGISLLRLSFYTMLGVLTLLIVFSAAWLGFTIAREFSGPLLALSRAAERVAQGDYGVVIDEFVSDDEMGMLAQSFRSMVLDLRAANEQATATALDLSQKAKEIERNSEYNALLVKHVHSGILALTVDGVVTTWNQMVEELFGVPASVARGRPVREVIDVDFYDVILGPVFSSFMQSDDHDSPRAEEGTKTTFQGVIEGRERNLQVKIVKGQAPIRDECKILGEERGGDLLVLIEDVTDLERAQRVAAWRDVARRVAHEIKNPLTPISLGIQRIQRRFLPRLEGTDLEVFQDSVRIVMDSTESIRRLVEEFNRFARMPQALLKPGNLIETVQLALDGFESNDGKQVDLSVTEIDPETRVENSLERDLWAIRGKSRQATFDKDQILRMVSNLVANALEACDGDPGRVKVTVQFDPVEGYCYLQVADDGPGIPKNLRSRVFEPYFSTRRRGSGLGLPIVRQIVTEHGGDIGVFDHQPKGTVFKISLPILASQRGKDPSTSTSRS